MTERITDEQARGALREHDLNINIRHNDTTLIDWCRQELKRMARIRELANEYLKADDLEGARMISEAKLESPRAVDVEKVEGWAEKIAEAFFKVRPRDLFAAKDFVDPVIDAHDDMRREIEAAKKGQGDA